MAGKGKENINRIKLETDVPTMMALDAPPASVLSNCLTSPAHHARAGMLYTPTCKATSLLASSACCLKKSWVPCGGAPGGREEEAGDGRRALVQ